MNLYHGSPVIVEKPIFEYRNHANDYGSGFYCTQHFELAGEWACRKNSDGFINCYEIDMSKLSICRLNSPDYNILNWIALLTRYRGYWQKHSIAEDAKKYLQEYYFVDISEYDAVIGYRADDSYFSFVQDFVAGAISLEKISRAMKLGTLGEQIVLKSKIAFDEISFLGYEVAYSDLYFQKKARRDLAARREYASLKNQANLNDIYMIDIMRGKVTADDLRI